MKHIAAYALLVLGGKAEPKAADVSKVLKEAGATADDDKVKALCEALKGKAFHELVAEGSAKLGSMGSGSGAPELAALLLAALLPLQRKHQRRKNRKKMWTWAASSAMMNIEEVPCQIHTATSKLHWNFQ